MYFDFDDYQPDTPRVMTSISWREGVLLSIIFHLLMVITLILSPKLFTMLVLMALVVWTFIGIKHHYEIVDRDLSHIPPEAHHPIVHTVIVVA